MINIEEIDGKTIVHYYYNIDTLKKEVDMRTSYLGRFRKSEDAAHLLDRLRFSGDESDLFTSFLKSAMAEIFMFIGKSTNDVENAYIYEPENKDAVYPFPYKDSVHYTISWNERYNKNYIQPVDRHIFDALVWYILWRWLMLAGLPDEAEVARSSYGRATTNIQKDSTRTGASAFVNKTPRIF